MLAPTSRVRAAPNSRNLFEDLRRAFSEFMATIALRSAGAIVFLGCSAFLVAIASYSAEDFELQQCDGPRPA